MDIKDLPKVVILIWALNYVTEGTIQNENLLETTIVGRDKNHKGAQDTDTVITSPKDGSYKLSYADYEVTWRNYKSDHSKKYSSSSEEQRRFAIFMGNVKNIEAHNMKYHLGQSTYWMNINHFSDWTRAEFTAWLGPQVKEGHSRSKREADDADDMVYEATEGEELPQAIDWTARGFVTQIKNQADCGSCYAFSTTGSVEGQWFRKTNKLINLSEQQIVDCSTDFANCGCCGGNKFKSFRYIMEVGGLQNETTYPYVAKQQNCLFNKCLVAAKIENYYTVAPNEEALKSAVGTQGPVSVSIYVNDNFMQFGEGIYSDPTCLRNETNHALLVVGYGKDSSGEEYWIVKNCWGKEWGQSWAGAGYIKIAMNTGDVGMCGIALKAAFPVVSDASKDDLASCHGGSKKLENAAITVLVTSTLVFLNFIQILCF